MSLKEHWNAAYQKNPTEKLGWFEETPYPTTALISKTGIQNDARILVIGAGSSTLIDYLVENNYSQIIAHDISSAAFDNLKLRLGNKADKIEWLLDDLCKPEVLDKINPVDLWIDRAVLHFLTEETDRKTYFDLLRAKVKSGGYVIIAEFNLEGAEKCSGLPVYRYNQPMIENELGADFNLIEAFNYTFINPGGAERPYIYTLFQRK